MRVSRIIRDYSIYFSKRVFSVCCNFWFYAFMQNIPSAWYLYYCLIVIVQPPSRNKLVKPIGVCHRTLSPLTCDPSEVAIRDRLTYYTFDEDKRSPTPLTIVDGMINSKTKRDRTIKSKYIIVFNSKITRFVTLQWKKKID